MRVKVRPCLFILLLLTFTLFPASLYSEEEFFEYSESITFICDFKVKVPSRAEPGDWLPVTIELKALRSLSFIVDVTVHYGWGRWSNWTTLLDRKLSFGERVTLSHSVKIPEDVETGPVLVWVMIQYTNDNYYCREGARYYYRVKSCIFPGPYIIGTLPSSTEVEGEISQWINHGTHPHSPTVWTQPLSQRRSPA